LKLGELIDRTARRFSAARLDYGHGTDNARDEAAFLVIRGLRLPFAAPLSRDVDQENIEFLVKRRIEERIPAAYLLREAWLDGIRFYVDERVIVPRSHIAFLLKGLDSPKRVLDLCTGSGCLAVLAARAFPRAKVTASDISAGALAVAIKNVARHRLHRRVRLLRSDLFKSIRGSFDLIVANPPYVDARAMKELPPESRREPVLALAAGSDGLNAVRRILAEAKNHLAPNGLLVCEVGDSRRALARAYPKLPFKWPHASVFALRQEEMG
jgi:ribosomal protein L3 glutamine methyltransferase